jgi:hypothetical protein
MPKSTTKPKATDWERVKREALQEAPIAHAEDDGPYDPNDAAAAAAYWQQASIKRGRGRPAVAVKRPTRSRSPWLDQDMKNLNVVKCKLSKSNRQTFRYGY